MLLEVCLVRIYKNRKLSPSSKALLITSFLHYWYPKLTNCSAYHMALYPKY